MLKQRTWDVVETKVLNVAVAGSRDSIAGGVVSAAVVQVEVNHVDPHRDLARYVAEAAPIFAVDRYLVRVFRSKAKDLVFLVPVVVNDTALPFCVRSEGCRQQRQEMRCGDSELKTQWDSRAQVTPEIAWLATQSSGCHVIGGHRHDTQYIFSFAALVMETRP